MSGAVTKESVVKRVLHAVGPGVTAGAADDDPSGVATYSIVGAQFGTYRFCGRHGSRGP